MSRRFLPRGGSTLLALALFTTACGTAARRNNVKLEPTPAWKTPDGRKAVMHEVADWYIENELPAEALEMVERMRQEGQSGRELDLIYGEALLATGVDEEARHVLEGVSAEYPDDPRPLHLLAIIYSDAGELDLALTTLERAADIEPDNVGSRNNLGFLYFVQDRCEEAQPHFEYVISQEAMNPRYRNNLAFNLVCLGENERALKLFRSTGGEADARYNMGVALERYDKLAGAFLQYQHAVRVNPEHDSASEALARLSPHGFDNPSSATGVQ